MKSLLLAASILSLQVASAHLLIGTHKGTLADGTECSIEVKSVYYMNNVKHPLNERADVVVNGENFTIQHPPVISVADKNAAFDHDHFQGINATKLGGQALVIDMVHTETFEGAGNFHVITHEYRTDKKEVSSCMNLQFVQ